jgi:membrane protein YdbS with pleckstrin-like domain
MRLITPGDTAPASVNRYLLPHEHQVITVRMHPATLLGPIILVLIGLVAAGVLTGSVAHHNRAALDIIWLAWGFLLLRLIVKVANWSVDYFVVTSQRMLLVTGLVDRKVAMMPLVKVTDMSFQRSAAGRLFGYGEFILESAGQDQAFRRVPFVPYPEQLYLEVCGLIFPSQKDEGDD